MSETSPLEVYFLGHGLSWNAKRASDLATLGVEVVEHLKMLRNNEFEKLFEDEPIIMKRLAMKVLGRLKATGDVDPKKCAAELGIRCASITSSSASKRASSTLQSPGSHNSAIAATNKSMKSFIKYEFLHGREETKRRRLERNAQREAEIAAESAPGASSNVAGGDEGRASGSNGVEGTHGGDASDGGDAAGSDDEIILEVNNLMDIDDDETEVGLAIGRQPRLLLCQSNWRDGRCIGSKDLKNAAKEDEKLAWDNDLFPEEKTCDDFEDPKGWYKSLGGKKETSDVELAQRFDTIKKTYHNIARRCHPDKNPTEKDRETFDDWKDKYSLAKRARDELCMSNDDGIFEGRIKYDLQGEKLRKDLRDVVLTVYNCSIQERAGQIRERLKRGNIYQKKSEGGIANAMSTTLAKISKRWAQTGKQQKVHVHTLCAKAFKSGHTNAEVALEIRRYTYRGKPFDVSKKSSDEIYRNLMKTMRRYRDEWMSGKLDKVMSLPKGKERAAAMRKKSAGKKGRGRQVMSGMGSMEVKLEAWIVKCNTEEKRVTSTMIFRKVVELDPNFLGGVESDKFMIKLKKWFYYGFIKRANLSVRKLASVGQKLPVNWQEKMVDLRARIRERQDPQRQPDGTVAVEGVKDKHYVNTDHVPFWIESVGNTSWGKKDSGRRTVKTAGKEKDRFTVQLSITKDGGKLPPFIIFKGEL